MENPGLHPRHESIVSHKGVTRIGILGRTQVLVEGTSVAVPAAKQRVVLAALALQARDVVSTERLADFMWGNALPGDPVAVVRNYVLRLRRTLGALAGSRIVTCHSGYLLEAAEHEVDVLEFTMCCRMGAEAVRNSEWRRAVELLEKGFSIWRGDPLRDVPSEILTAEVVPRLENLRLQAAEWLADARLHLGLYGELITELQDLTNAHPLRERFQAQLMLALYKSGRKVEALAVYRRTRSALAVEVGMDPSAELQDLHQRILVGDPSLAPPGWSTAGSGSDSAYELGEPSAETEAEGADVPASQPAVRGTDVAPDRVATMVPRQLPAAVAGFVGRSKELGVLADLTDRLSANGGSVVVLAIVGAAGIGKTALAVHWAHQVSKRFPDGQLYVNMRGFDPVMQPMQLTEVMRGFLDALGVPADRVPTRLDAQITLYRSLLASRQVLQILDNVRDAEHARPLLPGGPGSLVLVTSRCKLVSLAALDGARLLTLTGLDEADARALLKDRLEPGRVGVDPALTADLASLCGGLPLALAITAARAATRPDISVAELVAETGQAQCPLDAFSVGDVVADLRSAFSASYRQLSSPTARAFRLLGAHRGIDITIQTVASMSGVSLTEASRMLTELADLHLVNEHAPGRYSLHELLRHYAVEQATRMIPVEIKHDRPALIGEMMVQSERKLALSHVNVEFSGAREGEAPFTWGQRAMWDAMARNGQSWNLGYIVGPLRGQVDVASASMGISRLLGRHEALRTFYRVADGVYRQVVMKSGVLQVAVADSREETARDEAERLKEALRGRSFQLDSEFPIRVSLVAVDGFVRYVVMVFSHVAVDFNAAKLVQYDLRDMIATGSFASPQAVIQPMDLAQYECNPPEAARVAEYWTEQLRRIPPTMFSIAGPAHEPQFQGVSLRSAALPAAASRLAQIHGTTASTVVLAASAMVLGARTRYPVAMNVHVGNRFKPDYRNIVGNLVQLGLFVLDVPAETDFNSIMQQATRSVLRAYRSAHYDPLVIRQVRERVSKERGAEINPLCCFNTIDRESGQRDAADGLTAENIGDQQAKSRMVWSKDAPGSRCRFCMMVGPTAGEGLMVHLRADTRYLPPDEIVSFLYEVEDTILSSL
jgi:DNA-binding SARP family transcriptional activator